MPAPYEQGIHETLTDSRLQTAVYTSTGRLASHRRAVVSEDALPDFEDLRTQGNLIKKHAIENLDYYLEQFEANAAAHGVKVIWAPDAAAAVEFVAGLAKEKSAHLIVKSKSMTTEEIELNERLAHHGLDPVETDLGEFIIQLAHQRPYHIVAPALHLTRSTLPTFSRSTSASSVRPRSRSRRRSPGACCASAFSRQESASAVRIS